MRSAKRFIGWLSVVVVALTLAGEVVPRAFAAEGEELIVHLRSRGEIPDSGGQYRVF